MFRWLDDARKEMIPLQIYFTSGLSGETEGHFEETIKVGRKITREYPVVSIGCNAIELEPASPRFLNPQDYGISLQFKNFIDYYRLYRNLAMGLPTPSHLGYRTRDLSESQIIEFSHRFRNEVALDQHGKLEEIYRGT